MTIRKEILEAIKDGTITPEEGLNLLEEIEQAETIDGEKKTESAKTVTEPKIASVQESEEVEQKVISESVKEAKYQNQVESSQESGAKLEQEVDYEANQELKTGDPKTAQETKQEKLQETEFAKQKEKQLEPEKTKDHIASLIDEWETNDHQLHTNDSVEKPKDAPEKKAESKENASLMKLNQLDQQIQPLNEMLKTKQETFRNLKLEVELEIISEENLVLYQQTQKEIAELETKIKQLKQEKGTVEKDFYSIPVWQTEMPNHDDTPEEFYEHEEEVDEPFVRPDNFNSRINQLVNRTLKTVADTVDGKWSDIKLPAVGNSGNTRFDHRFNFKEEIITNLDVKLANGSIIFKTWPRSYIMVDAEIKLHGKMYEGDPMESFMERSQIAVEYEHLLFHVHNKRVSAELTFHLPEQTYNHIKIRMLNGNLTVKNVEAEDLFVKSARGELVFKNIGTAVLEIQGTDNEIEIDKGVIVDSIIETVNGSIVSTADVANVDASLVNGDIKLSIGNSELKKIRANSINGNIKVSFPTALGLEGVAKTSLGKINYRLSDFQTVRERNDTKQRLFHFRRPLENPVQIDISSKTGNIFLKDFDR
ncbi:daptomycin-sensing surface protein LiaX [Enterococcus sp. AZ072]|uniref:daptomycin-sensing surface protein LiaX n=1 Tax=unclassified Enterococcus TaxID=2608891 RepID=UPI003D269847